MGTRKLKKPLYLFFTCPLLLVICFIVAKPSFAATEKIIVVKQRGIRIYAQVLSGFESTTKARIRVVEPGSGPEANVQLIEAVHDSAAPLVFTIGQDSLARAAALKKSGLMDARILYAMALDPAEALPPGPTAAGVGMAIAPPVALDTLKKVLPSAKRIGVVYTVSKTGYIYSALVKAARQRGMAVKGIAVSGPRQFAPALDKLAGKIDVLYMLPDITVLDSINLEYMMEFSLERRVPVFAISGKYVENGALLALSLNPYDIGRQAGEMANRILSGRQARGWMEFARGGALSINLRVARILGIKVPEEAIKTAVEIVK
ncbi:MAG: ABC transporter substrate binding protein [Actinomycetota bacterium]|nr:ABC transporter substrate binding protein [Actinomycetota bacterium]